MTKTPALMENQEIIKETIDTARSLTSINITMQLLSWDVFWGSLPGHSYRIDGNEESTTGKQYPGPIIIRNS